MATVRVKALDSVSDSRLSPTFLTPGVIGECSQDTATELQNKGFVKIIGKVDTKEEKPLLSSNQKPAITTSRSFVNEKEVTKTEAAEKTEASEEKPAVKDTKFKAGHNKKATSKKGSDLS